VACDNCKTQMTCVEKSQSAALVTRTIHACSDCGNRVVIYRQGERREDVGAEEVKEDGLG
jgi:hypothetical protein